MFFTRRNLQTPGLIKSLGTLSHGQSPLQGFVQVVYMRQNMQDWKFVMGRCVLTTEPAIEVKEVYRDYAFLSKPVSDFSVETLLNDIAGDGYALLSDFPPIKIKKGNPSWEEEIIPSHAKNTEFPVRKFSANIDQDASFSDGQLIAFGMPFHLSAARRIRDFFAIKDFHGSSDGRKGTLSIEINDRRGAIHMDDTRLSIANRTIDLCLVGQINDGTPLKLMNEESVNIDGNDIRTIELWLLTNDNEIVDYRSSTEWPHRYEPRTDGPAYDEVLKTAIQRGENESCEFKQYIDLTSDQNAKATQLENTVCALSNTKGGRLFIGVDDGGEILGIDTEIRKAYGCELSEACTKYEKAIQRHLRELLKDNQCFSLDSVEIHSKLIFVITVQKSPELNFLLDSKLAYIRRGATSAKMTPTEIQSVQPRSGLQLIDGGSF